MEGFILRITAYHGEPKLLGKIPVRAGVSQDTPIPKGIIVNDPNNDVVMDLSNSGSRSEYTLDSLIEDFQDEYGCKVNYTEPPGHDSAEVFEFDVFEPSWPEQEEAEDVIGNLAQRLSDWVNGYPTGR